MVRNGALLLVGFLLFSKIPQANPAYMWLKESYLKMTGEGLRTALNSFRVFPDILKISREGNMQPCLMKEYKYSGYQITVCAMEEEFAEQIMRVALL